MIGMHEIAFKQPFDWTNFADTVTCELRCAVDAGNLISVKPVKL